MADNTIQNAPASQLAQTRPANTTAATAFTAVARTEITLIVIANTTASAATARLFHDDDGTTYDQTTALLYDVTVPANSSLFITAETLGSGLTVNNSKSPGVAAGTIGVRTGTNNALTFTLYGVVQAAR